MTYDDLKALHRDNQTLRFLETANAKIKLWFIQRPDPARLLANSVGHSIYSKYHVTICDNQVLLLLNPSNHCSPMSYGLIENYNLVCGWEMCQFGSYSDIENCFNKGCSISNKTWSVCAL